jgi:uncharacterized membrane protein
VITEVTIFFDQSKSELAAGLTLTVMLVMYTLYQSINTSLTKTAYLKMIDYWLIFCLLAPFTIFMIEIYWVILETKECRREKDQKWIEEKKLPNRKTIQVLVVSITLLFVVAYIICAIVISNNPF